MRLPWSGGGIRELRAVPVGSAVLHIGSPKTATSAIQYAAAAKRELLAERGVVYPMPRRNAKSPHRHRDGVRSLRAFGDGSSEHPKAWDALVAQLAEHPDSRMLISDEWASTLPLKSIRYAEKSLGQGSEVVFSVRNYGDFLLSLWQEDLRSGKIRMGLEAWVDGLDFSRRTDTRPGRIPIERQADRLVRWVDVFGADRVNVLIVDKSRPRLVYEAFATLLDVEPEDLAPGTPAEAGPGGNRGLTAVEAGFVEQLIDAAEKRGLGDQLNEALFSHAAFKNMQHARIPPEHEARLGMPPAAVDSVVAFAERQLETFRKLGVRVVGDPAEFTRSPRTSPAYDGAPVPVDVATAAVLGALEGALRAHPQRSAEPDEE